MDGRNWKRLASYAVNRRIELGYRTRSAFARALDGVTERTLGNLERGLSVSASTLAVIERGLHWEPGSAEAVLAGEQPMERRPADPRAAEDELKAQLRALWRSTTPETFFATVSALAAEMEHERRNTPGSQAN